MSGDPNEETAPVVDTETIIQNLWETETKAIQAIVPETENWKKQNLPLARVKKIMKTEDLIHQAMEKEKSKANGDDADAGLKTTSKFMISNEAPIVVGKACELIIKEIAARAWQHTERNRRRTLQRQDIHAAVGETETFDFLIDVVPRVATSRPPANMPPVDTQDYRTAPEMVVQPAHFAEAAPPEFNAANFQAFNFPVPQQQAPGMPQEHQQQQQQQQVPNQVQVDDMMPTQLGAHQQLPPLPPQGTWDQTMPGM